MKDTWYMAACLLAIIFLGLFMYVTAEFQEASETIRQQKLKIDSLQEENRMLQDDIWNLNRHLIDQEAE